MQYFLFLTKRQILYGNNENHALSLIWCMLEKGGRGGTKKKRRKEVEIERPMKMKRCGF